MAPEGGITFFASCVTLCKTIIGAGLLALPFAQAQTGVVLGLVLLLAMAAVQAFVLHLFAICVVSARGPGKDPPSFFSLALGAGLPPVVVESCVGLATFGFATSYLVVMADNAPAIAASALSSRAHLPGYVVGTDADNARYFWISLLGGVVGLPLMMLPQLDMLKFSSVIGNVGIIYVVVVTALIAVGVLPGGDSRGGGSASGSALDLWAMTTEGRASAATTAACRSWGDGCAVIGFPGNIPDALSVLSIYVFAFACTQSIPAIMAEMQNATLGRVNGVILVSISCCTAVFAICGLAGYYTYGAAVNADLLKCFAKNAISTVARAGILLSVTGSYPIFMYIVRKSVCKMLYNVEPNSLSCHKFVAITLCIFAPSYIIAMVVQSLDTILGFVGSTVGMLVGFTLPALIYVRLDAQGRKGVNAGGSLQTALIDSTGEDSLALQPPWKLCMAKCIAGGSALLIPVLVAVQIYSLMQPHKS